MKANMKPTLKPFPLHIPFEKKIDLKGAKKAKIYKEVVSAGGAAGVGETRCLCKRAPIVFI